MEIFKKINGNKKINMEGREVFKGLNIRKGMELNIPLIDIFKIKTKPYGNILALEIYSEKINNISQLEDKSKKHFISEEESITYVSKAETHKLNETLIAYVKNVYFASIEQTDDNSHLIEFDKFVEIDFVNTEELNLQMFLRNIMKAQEFSGIHEKNDFKHRFIGIGNFELDYFLENHNLISYSNLEFFNFFVYRFNILSGIDRFIFANYIKDIEEQKEYLDQNEYENALKFAKKHKNSLKKEFKNFLKL